MVGGTVAAAANGTGRPKGRSSMSAARAMFEQNIEKNGKQQPHTTTQRKVMPKGRRVTCPLPNCTQTATTAIVGRRRRRRSGCDDGTAETEQSASLKNSHDDAEADAASPTTTTETASDDSSEGSQQQATTTTSGDYEQ
ncbi:expressed unknown protein [Seminavis robusta]|uniref:Uncharacterized protein n=1 Tax=Seminavis robusta TaxID=568900 RepID=A0A9N8E9A7_9STRA|nr:expressed unknown protein [Seminavis robusta]|eukprot:Sro768_g199710.1 n/a (139) ;mRNA; f:48424-48936